MKNNSKLIGKNVLITAGAQGIGESITKHFIDSGANVAIHYFSSADTANQLAEYGIGKKQKAIKPIHKDNILEIVEALHLLHVIEKCVTLNLSGFAEE